MRRPFLILAALLLAGAAVFYAGQRLAAHCAARAAAPADDLAWLRLEFGLTDAQLGRVRQLHEGYLPKCREFCQRIDARKRELMALLAAGDAAPALIEQKLVETGVLRAQCQAAMLQHFREISQAMPPDQGRRYLAQMQRLTLGAHEQLEHVMTPEAPASHGHSSH